MKDKVSINLKCSAEEYARALDFIKRQSFLFKNNSVKKYIFLSSPAIFIISILLIIYFLFGINAEDFVELITFSAIPAILLSVIVIGSDWLSPWFLKLSVAKQIKSSPALQDNLTISFSDSGIESSGELILSSVKWEAFTKAMETETDFFLFTSNKFAQFIPKDSFILIEDENFVRCLIRAKLGNKAEF